MEVIGTVGNKIIFCNCNPGFTGYRIIDLTNLEHFTLTRMNNGNGLIGFIGEGAESIRTNIKYEDLIKFINKTISPEPLWKVIFQSTWINIPLAIAGSVLFFCGSQVCKDTKEMREKIKSSGRSKIQKYILLYGKPVLTGSLFSLPILTVFAMKFFYNRK